MEMENNNWNGDRVKRSKNKAKKENVSHQSKPTSQIYKFYIHEVK